MIKTVSKFSDSAESLKRVEMEGQYPFYKTCLFQYISMQFFRNIFRNCMFFFETSIFIQWVMWWSTVISVYVYPARVLTTKTVDGEPGPDHCVQDAEGGEGHVELSRRFWGRTVRKAYTVDGSEIPRLTTWDGWKPINNGIYYHHWWWQLKYSLFSPRTLGMISNLTNNFQRVGSTTNYSYMFGFVWLVNLGKCFFFEAP